MGCWNTDGGIYDQVIQPMYNVIQRFFPATNEYRLDHPPTSETPLNPQPLGGFGLKEQGTQQLVAVFKCIPIDEEHYPITDNYELRYSINVVSYLVDRDGKCTQYTVDLYGELWNTTQNTRVFQNIKTAYSGWLGAGSYRCIDAYSYGYFGDDFEGVTNKSCGFGVYMECRHKQTGQWASMTDVGDAVMINRETLRNTYHIDISPSESEPDPEEDDPNDDDDGYSGPGGGDGNHDRSTDDIGVPSLPTLSATGTGFVTLYKCNLAQIRAVAAELWTSTLWDLLKNLFTDPLQFIIGVTICPCTPDLLQGGYYPTIGNILGQDVRLNTPLQVVSNQYKEVDCGTIQLDKYYGSALDYSPYEKIQIHLPYCGSHDLDVDEVMGSTIGVKYHCDVLTGACVAFVTITNDETTACVRYQYTGNIISHIPITERSFDEVIKSVAAMGAAAVGTLAASTGAGGAIGEGISGEEADSVAKSSNGANVMTVKPSIMRSGTLTTALGLLGLQKPFITRTIPRQSLPLNYKTYEGYPSNITEKLGSLSGFTKIYSIRPNGFTCTTEELDEVITMLKGGVLF